MKMPRWLLISLLSASLLAVLAAASWWWVTWPERTATTFAELIRDGKYMETNRLLVGAQWTTSNDGEVRLESFDPDDSIHLSPYDAATWFSHVTFTIESTPLPLRIAGRLNFQLRPGACEFSAVRGRIALCRLDDEKKDNIEVSLARSLCPALPGYESLQEHWRIETVRLGDYNMHGFSLHPHLRGDKAFLVNAAWWFNPITDGHPKHDWFEFLTVHERCNEVACHHQWLWEWRNAGINRTIDAQIVGTTPNSERDVDFWVGVPWMDAGLRGRPEFEVLLRRDREWCATMWFGTDESRALVTTAKPGIGIHWLDQLDFSYHPKGKPPTYLIVDRDGNHSLRFMSPADLGMPGQ